VKNLSLLIALGLMLSLTACAEESQAIGTAAQWTRARCTQTSTMMLPA